MAFSFTLSLCFKKEGVKQSRTHQDASCFVVYALCSLFYSSRSCLRKRSISSSNPFKRSSLKMSVSSSM